MVINKNILVTAGSTWVALDKVRVISNTASGRTGLILAKELKRIGARVTLLLGPGDFSGLNVPGIKVIHFKYFSELKSLLNKELRKQKYSTVIHAAAVADYKPDKIIRRKISSRLNTWKINLVPTEKLVNSLKKFSRRLITIGFKFEPDAKGNKLIGKGRQLLKEAKLDIVVANSNKNMVYQAYILNNANEYGPFLNKTKMAICLAGLLKNKLR